ncbi:MAG: hypothetical protein KF845_03270 [Cyclobacteriaceae bacterium]|nr:hypothetical protein [Cyclobacteriaceae bacterium]
MRTISTIIFVLTATYIMSCSNENKNSSLINGLLSPDIKESIAFLTQYQECIDSMKEFKAKKYEILSVVFPEIIRWNAFQDIIETEMNGLLSTNADFSIGIFQMKPSFVKNMEDYVLKYDMKEFDFILIQNLGDLDARAERISRMSQPHWQFKYAFAYWHVAEHRFKEINFTCIEDRIQFFAAAYNYGFLSTIDEIREWQNKKVFPYGSKYPSPQDSYSNIALIFYNFYNQNSK